MTRQRARPELLLGAGTLVSRALGFAKAILLVAAIGGTSSAAGGQIFDVANTLPTALYALVAGGALSSILIPEIARAIRRDREGELGDSSVANDISGREHIDQILSLTAFAAVILTAALLVLAPLLVNVYALAWPESWLRLGTLMALWCIPQVFFLIQFGTFSQVLLAHGRFAFVAWAPALSNAATIGSLLVFLAVVPSGLVDVEKWTTYMVALVCGGATLGAIAQFALVGFPVFRLGHRPRFRIRPQRFARIGINVLWGFLAVLCWQGSYVVISNVASAAGAQLTASGIDGASLNSLSNAYLVFLVPHGVIAVSLITASYTRMSHHLVAGEIAPAWAEIRRTARLVAVVSALFTAVFGALGPLIGVAVWNAAPIGSVLTALAAGLGAFSLIVLVQRVSYALGDARSPFLVQLVTAAATVIGVLVVGSSAPPAHVVVLIALVISAATWVGLFVGIALLGRHREFRGRVRAARRGGAVRAMKLAAVALVTSGCAWLASSVPLGDLGWSTQVTSVAELGIGGAVALGVFVGLAHVVGEPAVAEIVRGLRRQK